jgi:DNA-binding NarL/FixJ family response regulator
MTPSTHIVLADDHALMRDMLGSCLDRLPDIHVVARCGAADEALAAVRRFKPDVVILDIDMPGMSCFEAARAIRAECPESRTIFLSSYFHDAYVDQALAVEAAGYVTKSEPPEVVIEAVRAVRAGLRYFSAEVEARLVVEQGRFRLGTKRRSRVTALSDRELEILRYIARGLSRKEIAQASHISPETAHRHTTNVMRKLQIHDRVELARFAIREGLIQP